MNNIGTIPGSTTFIDFGCSNGNSIRVSEQMFGGPGIGIDINDKKLSAARAAGFDARKVDLFADPLPENCVRFVSMIHVLEHLNSEQQVKAFLAQGVRAAREFVMIRFPYFDADGVLAKHGRKFYHSDWHGHPMPLSTLQTYRCIRDIAGKKVREFHIAGRQRLEGEVEGIIPIEAPIDTTKAQAATYGTFNLYALDMRLYKELAAVIVLNNNPQLAPWVLSKMKVDPADILVSCGESAWRVETGATPSAHEEPARG